MTAVESLQDLDRATLVRSQITRSAPLLLSGHVLLGLHDPVRARATSRR